MPQEFESQDVYDYDAERWVSRDKLAPVFPAGIGVEQGTLPVAGVWGPPVEDPLARRQARLAKIGIWVAFLGTLVLFLSLLSAWALDFDLKSSGRLGLLIGFGVLEFVSLIIVASAAKAVNPSLLREDDFELLEDPEDTNVCLVTVDIYVDGKTVGSDRGAAYFEGGAMRFIGARTSFTIGGQDVVPRGSRHSEPAEHAFDEGVSFVPLVHPEQIVWVRLRPIDRRDLEGRQSSSKFRMNLLDFRDRPKNANVPRQYPPLGDDR